MIRAAIAAAGAAAALSACSGGSSPPAQPSLSPTPANLLTKAPGGLVGIVDAARVAAVCANIDQASQLVGTGIATDQAAAAVRAAITQLAKPPLIVSTLHLADVLREDVRRHNLSAAVNAGLKWCTQQHA